MTDEIIPDPNGDRQCYQRFWHQESETVVIDGIKYCADCRPKSETSE